MSLQFRRGTDAQRTTITPDAGEPLWTTNTNRLYVGDGVTPGGVAVEIPLPSTGTFTSLTVTNIHFTGDPVGVDQTTAWTGTVAWSQIGSKPNGGLYTTSSVEFNQLSVTGSAITATQSSILVNASGSTAYQPPHQPGYLVWGVEQTVAARLVTDTYSNSNGSVWTGRRARGTVASPTAVQNNDIIFRVAGTGFGTTQFANTSSGYLDIIATENFTDGARGTKITLNTTNAGTNTPNASLSVASDGTIITAPQASASESALTVNQTGGTTYPAPPNSGNLFWGISNDANSSRVLVDNYGTSPFATFLGRAGRGTAAAPSAVQADDTLMSLRANGYGTTGFNSTSSGFINFSAIENFTDTSRGTRMQIYATAPGDTFASLVSTHRADGTFIYSTATSGSVNAQLIVQGSYPNLIFEDAQAGTNILAVNTPGQPARISIDTYADDLIDNIDKSYLAGRRARGTAQAPSAMLSGDSMLRVAGYAYGTTGFINTASAGINFNVVEDVTDLKAGGEITFDVMSEGTFPAVSAQLVIAKMDANGIHLVDAPDFILNNQSYLSASNATQTNLISALNGSVALLSNPNQVRVEANNQGALISMGGFGNDWRFNTNGTLTFPDATVQNTAWTGSVSTSSVTGLATVAWTGKYSDLTGEPNQALDTTSSVTFGGVTVNGNFVLPIASLTQAQNNFDYLSYDGPSGKVSYNRNTNQNLFTTSTVGFSGLNVSTGTQLTKTLSIGGYPLNAAGTSSFSTLAVVSPTLIVSNTTPGQNAQVIVRGFGQNNPNGGAATNPNPNIRLENAFGTNAAPTTITANQNLGGFLVGGYDGRNWPVELGQSYNFLGWFATETMTNDGSTSTYQAGSGFNIYVQPQWTRPGINTTRQRLMINSWTTSSTGPSQMNLSIGSGVDSVAPTMTMVDGTTYTGYGRANILFPNSNMIVSGVPSADTAPDNATLTGTNIVTILGSRRSGVSTRRNPIVIGDNLGGIQFNGQSASNSTGLGVTGATIVSQALDNFSGGTTRGANLVFQTVNSGTAVTSNRLILSDRFNSYRADQHQFVDKNNFFIPLSFTTSTWNASCDSTVFGNTAGSVNMLTMNTSLNEYRNTSHKFTDRTGSFTALNMTTATAVFTSIPQFPSYTAAAANAITGALGQQICISNSASGGNPNGMMAFWDTTNNRWSYIHDNSAV